MSTSGSPTSEIPSWPRAFARGVASAVRRNITRRKDAVDGSILIGCLLAAVSFIMAREMKGLLLGEAATPQQQQAIREILESNEGARDVVYVRTLHLGPDDMLKPKSHSRAALSFRASRIRSEVPAATVIAIEPGSAESDDMEVPGYEGDEGLTQNT